MTSPSFATSADARKAGWHSRRHQTNEEQREARVRYKANAGREARLRRLKERLESRREEAE